MTRTLWYPTASKIQRFDGVYPGSVMALDAPVLVLHTTEGPDWPSYQGGAVAPTFTVKSGRQGIRQHFPVNMSSRALVNLSGGVQTNTQGTIQVEMIGTCDPAARGKYFYWPDATDDDLAGLVDLVRWLRVEWALKVQSTVRFVAYPASYANGAGQRLTGAQWTAYEGILGHQHVPENLHGDPGAFPIAKLLRLAGTTGTPTSTPAPASIPTTSTKGPDMTKEELTAVLRAEVPRLVRTELLNVLNGSLAPDLDPVAPGQQTLAGLLKRIEQAVTT